MKILQIGFPKSGNFWLYQILEQVLTSTGRNSKSFIQQHPVNPLAKTWELNYPEQADIDGQAGGAEDEGDDHDDAVSSVRRRRARRRRARARAPRRSRPAGGAWPAARGR